MNEGLDHKHNYLLDVEAVFAPEGDVLSRGTIFLECVKGDCHYIIRDNEIIKRIEALEEENALLKDEITEFVQVFKQIQRTTEDPYWRTKMTANQMVDFLELLRKIVLDALRSGV